MRRAFICLIWLFPAAGAQLSNVRLPAPSLIPGDPIQVSNGVLPSRGVGLIIATDSDPRL